MSCGCIGGGSNGSRISSIYSSYVGKSKSNGNNNNNNIARSSSICSDVVVVVLVVTLDVVNALATVVLLDALVVLVVVGVLEAVLVGVGSGIGCSRCSSISFSNTSSKGSRCSGSSSCCC